MYTRVDSLGQCIYFVIFKLPYLPVYSFVYIYLKLLCFSTWFQSIRVDNREPLNLLHHSLIQLCQISTPNCFNGTIDIHQT